MPHERCISNLEYRKHTSQRSWPLARKTKIEVWPGDPRLARVEVTRGSCRSRSTFSFKTLFTFSQDLSGRASPKNLCNIFLLQGPLKRSPSCKISIEALKGSLCQSISLISLQDTLFTPCQALGSPQGSLCEDLSESSRGSTQGSLQDFLVQDSLQ